MLTRSTENGNVNIKVYARGIMTKKSPATKLRLITINKLVPIFSATAGEIEKWVGKGLIPIHSLRSFRKWGRSFEARMFDEARMTDLSQYVQAWRTDTETQKEGKKEQRKSSREQYREQLESGATVVPPPPPEKVPVTSRALPEIMHKDSIIHHMGWSTLSREEFDRWEEEGVFKAVGTRKYRRADGDSVEKVYSLSAIKLAAKQFPKLRSQYTEKQREIKRQQEKAIFDNLKTVADPADYPSWFPIARAMKRKLVFLAGETNSGKTYQALKMAGEAETAEVLSPLRLLAFEHGEALRAHGRPTGMITGEERLIDDGATHFARTIETASFDKVVDVAVIDEIQMLTDDDRGWAWTAALVGIPARTVVMTGSPAAIPMVKSIAKITNEPLEIIQLERKTPLRMSAGCGLEEVRKGDAIIVFSRKEVHQCRAILRTIGKVTTSAIYGALGPEVRRREASRFSSGKADVIVATDAIGMGLNLGNIKRVLFTSTNKYDGHQLRPLTTGEIKQIAGRAGRFGRESVGLVSTVKLPGRKANFDLIRRALDAPVVINKSTFDIKPTRELTEAFASKMETNSLAETLTQLNRGMFKRGSFRMANLIHMISIARQVDRYPVPMSTKFAFASAPVDPGKAADMSLIHKYMKNHVDGEAAPVPQFRRGMNLEDLEHLSRQLSLYNWFAQKLPKSFPDIAEVENLKKLTHDAIETRLISLAVVDKTVPDNKRRKQVDRHLHPHWFKDKTHSKQNRRGRVSAHYLDDEDDEFDDVG